MSWIGRAPLSLVLAALAGGGCAGLALQDVSDEVEVVEGLEGPEDPDVGFEDEDDADALPEDEEEGDASGGALAWLAGRGLDLLDVASARVAVGPGLLAHARVTPWIAAGAGTLGRPQSWAGGFEMKLYHVGWVLRGGGVWAERRAEVGISRFYYCETDPLVIAGDVPAFPPDSRGAWDVGAEAHLALIGAGAEVRLDQLLDFLAGWVGFDPSDDDGPLRVGR